MSRDHKFVVVDGARFTQAPERASGLACSLLCCLLNASCATKTDYGYYRGEVKGEAKGGMTFCIPCVFLITCGEKTYQYNQAPEKLVKVSDDAADPRYLDAHILVSHEEKSEFAICCCPITWSSTSKQALFSRQANVVAFGTVALPAPQSREPDTQYMQ